MTTKKQQALFSTELAPWELDDAEERFVAVVVFPEPPFGPFDYLVPDALRTEVAASGIRVSVLCPGVVRTAILDDGGLVRLRAAGSAAFREGVVPVPDRTDARYPPLRPAAR